MKTTHALTAGLLGLAVPCSVASAELANYHSSSVPVKKSLKDAQTALVNGFELCKPRGWMVVCEESNTTATCTVTHGDRVTRVGKVELIAIGEQTQVIASILMSLPLQTRTQGIREWIHFVEGRARDVCPKAP